MRRKAAATKPAIRHRNRRPIRRQGGPPAGGQGWPSGHQGGCPRPRPPGGPQPRPRQPDGLIAARLSGESPFTSTDLLSGESLFDDPPVVEQPPPEPEPEPETAIEELLAAAAEETSKKKPSAPTSKSKQKEHHHFQLSANAIDLESILGDFEAAAPPPKKAAPKAHAANEDVEVDLSIDLDGIEPGAAAQAAPAPRASHR